MENIPFNILLGSHSPRRRELLGNIGVKFSAIKLEDVDESYPHTMPASEVAEYLSRVKANAYREKLHENDLLITADTTVVFGERILGKPASRSEAVEMLGYLSGKTHSVITGVTLTTSKIQKSFNEVTKVTFGNLTNSDITEYIDTFRPFDKAGSYGIQEYIGMIGVTRIEGCFYNVMGLPTARLFNELKQFCAT